MFVKHQNIISDTQLLTNSLFIILFIILLDNMMINEHPAIISLETDETENFENDDSEKTSDSEDDNIVDYEKNEVDE
jgi:hypothetical protein